MIILNRHKRLFLVILVGGILYMLNFWLFRPYIYSCCDRSLFALVVGVLPNFIGTYLFGTIIGYFSSYTFLKVFLISIALPLFMEFHRNVFYGHNFDVNDIIASIISMAFVYLFLRRKYDIQANK